MSFKSFAQSHLQPTARNRHWPAVALVLIATPLLLPGHLAGQVAVGRAATCPDGAQRIGDLGVDYYCEDCSISYNPTARTWSWRFRSEPTIKHVASSGPSTGDLRPGDVLVSVDGSLITTRAGGSRLADLRPGRPVVIGIRRNGRDLTRTITPAAACPSDAGWAAQSAPMPPTPPSARASPMPALPPVASAPPSVARGVSGVLAPLPMQSTRAWFGFGLSCSNCTYYPVRQEQIAAAEAQLKSRAGGSGVDPEEILKLYQQLTEYRAAGNRWEFSENPRVFSVDDDGPAERAGLRRGDILTHIDGIALVSDEGGKRLGEVKPGDTVELVYRRGTTVGTAIITATDSPSRNSMAAERAYLRSQQLMERTLSRMERNDNPAVQEEVARIQQQLREAEALQRVATIDALRSARGETVPLRYSGSIGKVDVTVRSHGSVVVSRDEETGEVVITTSDATIRVKPE